MIYLIVVSLREWFVHGYRRPPDWRSNTLIHINRCKSTWVCSHNWSRAADQYRKVVAVVPSSCCTTWCETLSLHSRWIPILRRLFEIGQRALTASIMLWTFSNTSLLDDIACVCRQITLRTLELDLARWSCLQIRSQVKSVSEIWHASWKPTLAVLKAAQSQIRRQRLTSTLCLNQLRSIAWTLRSEIGMAGVTVCTSHAHGLSYLHVNNVRSPLKNTTNSFGKKIDPGRGMNVVHLSWDGSSRRWTNMFGE